MYNDRAVHAAFPGLEEIVRYDRSGKWYIEPVDGKRRQVGIGEAVARAQELQDRGGTIFLDLPGGGRFDHLVRRS